MWSKDFDFGVWAKIFQETFSVDLFVLVKKNWASDLWASGLWASDLWASDFVSEFFCG